MSAAGGRSGALTVALGEYDIGWHDPAGSLRVAAPLVERAADAGAELVVLPEMCTTGFTMDSARWAEPISGPSVQRLAALAERAGVHILAGVAIREREEGSREEFYNSALLFGPDGQLRAEYRKQELFAFAGENRSYSAGAGPVVVEIGGVRIAPFICFDLRFPELFRAISPEVDALVIIANWPAERRMHWDALVRARAIENQCYVVAVNRVGQGGELRYDGGSVVYDPWGERIADTAGAPDTLATATLRADEVGRIRGRYPFVPDLRR